MFCLPISRHQKKVQGYSLNITIIKRADWLTAEQKKKRQPILCNKNTVDISKQIFIFYKMYIENHLRLILIMMMHCSFINIFIRLQHKKYYYNLIF